MRGRRFAFWITVLAAISLLCPTLAHAARGGKLLLRVIDAETRKPVAVRMHLTNARGKPVRPSRLIPYWHDHFPVTGEILLELPRGNYLFELERGLEYKQYTGHFEINDHADDEKTVEMHRFTNLAEKGWWSGDVNVHRPVKDLPQLMAADDLHLAAVISWQRSRNKYTATKEPLQGVVQIDATHVYSDRVAEDARGGGGLLYFNLAAPLELEAAGQEHPSSGEFLVAAKRDTAVRAVAENAFWYDLPVWLASGRLDAITVAGDHLLRKGVVDQEAWGKPRDKVLFPAPHGNGRWSEQIYYQALNCGLRLPPVAGSGSGESTNPVGYNRAYVYCGDDFSWQAWWDNLAAGRVFITNGPLLPTTVQGEPPGHVFRSRAGVPISLEIGMTLSTREPIDYLEIIKDGRSLHQVRLDDFREKKGRLPLVNFDQSGWFLVRAVTNNQQTYRYASTGPYYVEFDEKPRISRQAVQFFLDWTVQRARQIKLTDPAEQAAVLRYHRAANDFWQDLLEKANAE